MLKIEFFSRLFNIYRSLKLYFTSDKIRIGIISICIVNFVYLVVTAPYGSLTWDEGIHVMPSIMVFDYFSSIMNDISVITPSKTIQFFRNYQRSYWINSTVLFFYPPLYWILTAFVIPFLGINNYSVRFVSILSIFFLGIITYELGKLFHSQRAGVIAFLLTMFFYEVLQLGVSALLDAPLTTLSLFATYYFWGAHKKGVSWYNRTGIFLGLALLMKQSAIIMLFIFILAEISLLGLTKTTAKNIIRILGFASVVAGPWYLFILLNAPYYLIAIWTVNIHQTIGPPLTNLSAWYHYGILLFRSVGISIGVLIFLGIAWGLFRRNENNNFLLLFVSIILMFFTISMNKQFRYILPCIPILFLYVGIGIDHATNAVIKGLSKYRLGIYQKKWQYIVFFLIFFFSFTEFLSINYPSITKLTNRPSLPLEEAAQYVAEHTPLNTNYKYRVLQIGRDNYFSPSAFSFYIMKYDRDHRIEILNPHSIESLKMNSNSINSFVQREMIYFIIFAIREGREFNTPEGIEDYFLHYILSNMETYIIEKVFEGYLWIHICHPIIVE